MKLKLFSSVILLAFLPIQANAVPVIWTDWKNVLSASSASGAITVGTTPVNVNYTGTGNHAFVQTGTGTNFWTGTAYTNGTVDNAPTPSEGVSLNQGGTVTITFSQSILNPYIAMNSWNGNVVDFGVPISIDSFGSGFWGTGTAALNSGGTGFTGNGEFHGVVKLSGSFTSISFNHTSENWHGFTVGVQGLGTSHPVPEPASLALLGLGLIGLIAIRRQLAV